MTTRLYYTEPWRREFDARVVEVAGAGAPVRVYLDRSAFYPTSGGQPADRGTLGDAHVVDVVDEEGGRVAHIVDGRLEPGAEVVGRIDWDRRFDHMQQHTGQHLLSAALERLHGARTESFHLGAEASTIDLAGDQPADRIAAAEALANRVVWEDRGVGIRFVTDEEAARLPLRKPPVKQGRLRLIEVEDFDLSACGGTHVSRTGEVGSVAVRGWERYKGGTRVEFVCGGRALRDLRVFRDAVTGATRALSVFPHELADGIVRLQTANKEAQREIRRLREQLAGYEGAALQARAERVGSVGLVLTSADTADAVALKALAAAASAAEGIAAVIVSSSRPALVAAAAHESVPSLDCGLLVRAMCERFSGKGGGKPGLAQGGGLDAPSADLLAFVRTWIEARLGSASV
jgi:alanyl-tRNA synthetase